MNKVYLVYYFDCANDLSGCCDWDESCEILTSVFDSIEKVTSYVKRYIDKNKTIEPFIQDEDENETIINDIDKAISEVISSEDIIVYVNNKYCRKGIIIKSMNLNEEA